MWERRLRNLGAVVGALAGYALCLWFGAKPDQVVAMAPLLCLSVAFHMWAGQLVGARLDHGNSEIPLDISWRESLLVLGAVLAVVVLAVGLATGSKAFSLGGLFGTFALPLVGAVVGDVLDRRSEDRQREEQTNEENTGRDR